MAPSHATTWVLTDGRAGNERQALALAHALSGLAPRVWRLEGRAPWRWIAPRELAGSAFAFGDAFRHALHDPPVLAIGCGRQAALATRLLGEAGSRCVQILNPRIDARHWDALIVPEHDALRGPQVVTTIGSLHGIDAAWLADARARWPAFGELPSPRTAVLLGGPIEDVPLDAAWWTRTVDALRTLHARDGGSVSVCASGRTPDWLREAARRDLSGLQGTLWLSARDGENPYPGLLGWAARIVVSPDSVNMVSEACATTADVRIAEPGIARARHARFLQAMMERQRIAPLADAVQPPVAAQPLIELPRVAAAVRALLGR